MASASSRSAPCRRKASTRCRRNGVSPRPPPRSTARPSTARSGAFSSAGTSPRRARRHAPKPATASCATTTNTSSARCNGPAPSRSATPTRRSRRRRSATAPRRRSARRTTWSRGSNPSSRSAAASAPSLASSTIGPTRKIRCAAGIWSRAMSCPRSTATSPGCGNHGISSRPTAASSTARRKPSWRKSPKTTPPSPPSRSPRGRDWVPYRRAICPISTRPAPRWPPARPPNKVHRQLKTAFPAKAGIHRAGDRAVEEWVPAFAGNAVLLLTARRLLLEVGDDFFAEEADRVEHLVVLGRADGAEEEHFLDAEGLVHFEKADAVLGRADAELGALFAHLLGRRLAGVRPAGEALVARVIALVIRRHGRRVIVAPHQAGALALLLDVPADQLGAAPGDGLRVLVAIAGRHQRGAPGRTAGIPQRILIERHQLLDAIGAAFAAEEAAHPEAAGEARRLVAAAGRP